MDCKESPTTHTGTTEAGMGLGEVLERCTFLVGGNTSTRVAPSRVAARSAFLPSTRKVQRSRTSPRPIPASVVPVCVVGDSLQSIYAFLVATIRNIQEFEREYPKSHTILVEQNYRSTQTILNAANAVIAKNEGRREKNLWTAHGEGAKIVGYVADKESISEAIKRASSCSLSST